MEIRYICTFWGQDHLPVEEFVEKAMGSGYDGVELNIPFDQHYVSSLLDAANKHGADLIAQQWIPPAVETVDQYRIRIKDYLKHLAAINPIFINSHTGKDFYSFDDNCTMCCF